jgi:multidrug resistance protein MdtO
MSATELVRDELFAVSSPRMARMLRMTAVVAFVLVFSMAKRVPEASVSAYMIFFIAQRDAAMTVTAALGGVLGLTIALALTLVGLLVSVGEPAVRVPLMVAFAFGGMYVMRSTPAGVLGLLLGFIPFYALTFVDWVPSPEVLVRALLWLWVFLAYPMGVLVLVDLAFGGRPAEIYRSGIAERLAAAAAYLEDDTPEARSQLDRYVRIGAEELAQYVPRSGPEPTAPIRATLLRQTELLGILARELPDEIRSDPDARQVLRRSRAACESARDTLLDRGRAIQTDVDFLAAARRRFDSMAPAVREVLDPLVTCVQTVALSVRELAGAPIGESPLIYLPKPRPPASAREGLQFALKTTLAATTAYLIYTGLDWYGIHTATITCFFVAGASVGATIHKLTLRLTGAIIGAALGMLALIFVLPAFESIGGLTVFVAAVTLFAAWVATGSERIAYAGFQIAISFYLVVLQGYGPTSKLSAGSDRIIGIIVGNILMSVVFTSIWPVRTEPAQRRALSGAALALAAILRARDAHALDRAETDFDEQMRRAREYDVLVWFEGARGRREAVLSVVQGVFAPVHAIVRTPVPASASPAVQTALASANASMADWFAAIAEAIATNAPAPPLPDQAPEPVAEDETAETRAHVHQHRVWLELLRAQCAELANWGPR